MDTATAIARDTDHGADELAKRAVLALLEDPDAEHARALARARPGMPVIANRVAAAWQAIQDRRGEAFLRDLEHEPEALRAHAATRVKAPIVTLSRSSAVDAAITKGPVWVLESRPGGEGRDTAARLTARGIEADWCPDDESRDALDGAGCVLLGCDALMWDGSIWNKVGSARLARAAHAQAIPVYAVTSTAKAAPGLEATDLWELSTPKDWFEAVDPLLIDAYITEQGILDPAGAATWVDRWQKIRQALPAGAQRGPSTEGRP